MRRMVVVLLLTACHVSAKLPTAAAKLPEEDGAEDAEGRGPPHGAQAVQVGELTALCDCLLCFSSEKKKSLWTNGGKGKKCRDGKYEEALEKFESVLGSKPEPSEAAIASYNVACSYSKLGRVQ
jgi:hypothetical protein